MAKISAKLIVLGVVGTIIAGAFTFKTIATSQVEKNLDDTLEKLGIKDQTTYKVSLGMFDFNTHIEDIKIVVSPSESLKIDEIIVKDFDSKHDTPEFLDMQINGIHTDTKVFQYDRALSTFFKDFNKSEVLTNIAINYSLEKNTKMLDLKNISINLREMGSLSLAMQLHDIAALDSLTLGVLLSQPQKIKVGKSTLTYKETSLIDTLLKYNAKQMGQDLPSFKEKMFKNLDTSIQRAKNNSREYEVNFLQAIATFLKDPKSLTLSIDPKEAVSFDTIVIQRGNEALKTLKFNIIAN